MGFRQSSIAQRLIVSRNCQICRLSNQVKSPKALGFTLLELVIVVIIVALLATFSLDRLFWYQGQAEKSNMEYTATMIKSGLWMGAASLMMADRNAEIPALAQRNPINLLAQKPDNYLGEFDGTNIAGLKRGNWFYDTTKQQVVYIVGQRHYFVPEVVNDFTVKYNAKILYGETEIKPGYKTPYITGITLVPISHYVWQ